MTVGPRVIVGESFELVLVPQGQLIGPGRTLWPLVGFEQDAGMVQVALLAGAPCGSVERSVVAIIIYG
jgi:hypothetical protein